EVCRRPRERLAAHHGPSPRVRAGEARRLVMSRPAVVEEDLLEAVADTSRRRVLDLILAHGEVTATELATELPFTRQAVAKHLAVLDRAGLVESRRHGRELRYSVRPEQIDVAARAMAKLAARWDDRLQAIKKTAEASARATGPKRTRAFARGGDRAS